MGVQNCDGCRSWVDDIYWTHFQFLHFVQFLRTGYDQQLALPKSFSDSLKKKLPENVSLKGPSGVVWNIGLTTRDDTLYFALGWQQFVKDHLLKENDFLVFKYNGESQFDVLIFDGGSLCEKASSYFVRKCGHVEHGDGCLNKSRDTDNSIEEGDTPSNAGVESASPEKFVHVNGSEPIGIPSGIPIEKTFKVGVESPCPEQFMADEVTDPAAAPSQTSGKRIRNLVSAVKHVQTKRRGRPPKSRAINWVTGSECDPVSVGKSATNELYISNRRPVTEEETKNVVQLAQAACTNDSLLVIMRPTHVYKRFFVSIPNKWIGEHISPRTQDVILRMGKGEWLAKYSFHAIRNCGGFTGGWKHFAVENNLEEFDVCVFKPAGQMNNTLVVNVTVFRVVEDIVPLSGVGSPGRRGRKPEKKGIQTES